MKTFEIEIKEVLSKTIKIKANSMNEAIVEVDKLYKNEEIVLDYTNHLSTDIDLKELGDFEKNNQFMSFILKNAEDMLSNLSIEELAKIGFGDLTRAINNFNLKGNDN